MKSADTKLADTVSAETDFRDATTWTRDCNSHYFYMGTKDGYDYVAQTWGNSHGEQGLPVFMLRVGELRIDGRHDVTDDYSRWQEIDVLKQ